MFLEKENRLVDALATLASVVMCLSDQTRTGSQAHPGAHGAVVLSCLFSLLSLPALTIRTNK